MHECNVTLEPTPYNLPSDFYFVVLVIYFLRVKFISKLCKRKKKVQRQNINYAVHCWAYFSRALAFSPRLMMAVEKIERKTPKRILP